MREYANHMVKHYNLQRENTHHLHKQGVCVQHFCVFIGSSLELGANTQLAQVQHWKQLCISLSREHVCHSPPAHIHTTSHIHTHTHTHTHMCTRTHPHEHPRARAHTHTHALPPTHEHTHTCVREHTEVHNTVMLTNNAQTLHSPSHVHRATRLEEETFAVTTTFYSSPHLHSG